jgi:ribosomal protein S18 acetylase RimI-like enzyme
LIVDVAMIAQPCEISKPRRRTIRYTLSSKFNQQITLRAATSDDEAFLRQLYASTRIDEFKWLNVPQQIDSLMTMQYDIRQAQYEAAYPDAESGIILQDDRPIGRMLIQEHDHEFVLVDIAILPEYRGAGIGSRLLQQLLDRAASADKAVRLQVFKTNPAQRLYAKLGFAEVGEQSMYIEMTCKPTATLDKHDATSKEEKKK